jgi:hypothetical protein
MPAAVSRLVFPQTATAAKDTVDNDMFLMLKEPAESAKEKRE